MLTGIGTRTDGIAGYEVKAGEGVVGVVLTERRSVRSDDYLADPRFTRSPAIEAWARAEGIVSIIGAPILDAAGEIIAFLWAFNRTPRPFTVRHEATMVGLAQQAALAVGKARSFEEERRRARQTAALLDIARACTSTLELTPLLKDIARRTVQAVGADGCAMFLWSGARLVPVMAQLADGRADSALWERFRTLPPHSMAEVPAHAEAIRSRQPVIVARGGEWQHDVWFRAFDFTDCPRRAPRLTGPGRRHHGPRPAPGAALAAGSARSRHDHRRPGRARRRYRPALSGGAAAHRRDRDAGDHRRDPDLDARSAAGARGHRRQRGDAHRRPALGGLRAGPARGLPARPRHPRHRPGAGVHAPSGPGRGGGGGGAPDSRVERRRLRASAARVRRGGRALRHVSGGAQPPVQLPRDPRRPRHQPRSRARSRVRLLERGARAGRARDPAPVRARPPGGDRARQCAPGGRPAADARRPAGGAGDARAGRHAARGGRARRGRRASPQQPAGGGPRPHPAPPHEESRRAGRDQLAQHRAGGHRRGGDRRPDPGLHAGRPSAARRGRST